MGRKKIYITNLSESEQRSLKKGYKDGKSYLYRRKCQCILLSNEGKNVDNLSKIFKVSKHSIYKWFKLWKSEGIKGLELQPGRGRKPKLNISDSNQVKAIKQLVENEPQRPKVIVFKIKEDLNIDLSKRTLNRFLKRLD